MLHSVHVQWASLPTKKEIISNLYLLIFSYNLASECLHFTVSFLRQKKTMTVCEGAIQIPIQFFSSKVLKQTLFSPFYFLFIQSSGATDDLTDCLEKLAL